MQSHMTNFAFMNQRAFVTLSYLNIIRCPTSILPFIVVSLVQAKVSLERVNKYMNNVELDKGAVQCNPEVKEQISIQNGTFKWGKDEPTTLKDVNLDIKPGSLTAIVGTVGSGKSSLLNAFLGELVQIEGCINTNGRVAYVPQQAWIQNSTVEHNIQVNFFQINFSCRLNSNLIVRNAKYAVRFS